MEALRRLRRNSSDTNVDRRLVTNVLLSFLTTPREDAKRFEMLGLLATVLSWSDPEREKAGLQRAQVPVPNRSFWSRSPAVSPSKSNAELDKPDETEVRLSTFFRVHPLVHINHFLNSTVVLSPMGRVPSHRSCFWQWFSSPSTLEYLCTRQPFTRLPLPHSIFRQPHCSWG
jgi:hypothetical protein